MKKIYTLLVALFVFGTMVSAQTYTVVFGVDMNNETPAAELSVAGNIQSADQTLTGVGDWTPGSHKVTDTDGDGIYTITMTLAAGDYQYKYINGIAWGTNEGSGLANCGVDDGNGGFNRTLTLSSDTTIIYAYNTCDLKSLTSTLTKVENAVEFTMAPNPFINQTTVQLDNANGQTYDIVISDVTGKVVRTMAAIGENQVTIQREDLVSGVYFLTVRNEEGQRSTKKFVVL